MRGYAAVGLIAPKKDGNVGGAMRAAHAFGASFVQVTGPVGTARSLPEDTSCAWRHMPIMKLDDPLACVPKGCVIVAVERAPVTESLVNFEHPERALYLFGPENGSIPADVLERCDRLVSIPTAFCMNLAATVNVVLYDRLAKATRMEPTVTLALPELEAVYPGPFVKEKKRQHV